MKIQLHPQGTRVRVEPGRFPMDRSLVGRTGTILHLLSGGSRYGVQLDEESRLRVFDESELQRIEAVGGLEETGEHRGGSGSETSM